MMHLALAPTMFSLLDVVVYGKFGKLVFFKCIKNKHWQGIPALTPNVYVRHLSLCRLQ
jgi:hypothetical protein